MNCSVNELIIICDLNSEIVKSWFIPLQVGNAVRMTDVMEAKHADIMACKYAIKTANAHNNTWTEILHQDVF